jgi:hypothetical protein
MRWGGDWAIKISHTRDRYWSSTEVHAPWIVGLRMTAVRQKAEAQLMKWLMAASGRDCVKTQNQKSQVGNAL